LGLVHQSLRLIDSSTLGGSEKAVGNDLEDEDKQSELIVIEGGCVPILSTLQSIKKVELPFLRTLGYDEKF
jgi:hypothetical protein